MKAGPRATRERLALDSRGAVHVEFLLAFLPVFLFFVWTWQFTELCAADLTLRRAADAAVRAASVVLSDDPKFYGGAALHQYSGERRSDIELAAAMILSSSPRFTGFRVEVGGARAPNAPITATVSARFTCSGGLPSLVCGGGASRLLTSRATYPYHGARYAYDGSAAPGNGGGSW